MIMMIKNLEFLLCISFSFFWVLCCLNSIFIEIFKLFFFSIVFLKYSYNMGGLFSWAVGEDDRNSSRHVIQIDQGGLTLPTRDNYLNKTAHEKVLTAYLDYMTKVAVLLGGNENDSKQQMKEVIEFETKIAEITGNYKFILIHLE